MSNQQAHSDAIGRWLMGERGPAAANHFRDCPECRAEVARLESTLAGFRDAAQQWSGRQPLARPPAGWTADSLAPRRRLAPVRWAAAAAAITLLLASLPVYRDYSRRQAAAEAKANALLLDEISTDLSRPAPEPLEPIVKLVSQSTSGDNQ